MQFHEEVYTSAPELLEGAARSNLGIVAKSRGFPKEVEGDLTFRQSYTLLEGIPVHEPAAHPQRFFTGIIGAKKEYFAVSRTVFAGSDHTGRTTPLSHHLVFNIQEMAQTGASPAGILSALLASGQAFKEKWNQPPAWIDPPRTLPQPTPPEQRDEFPGAHWSKAGDRIQMLAAISDGLLAFSRTQRRLIICIPIAMGRFVEQFVSDMLTLVPMDVQMKINCVSHVVEVSDCPQDAALVFTYPNTTFFAQNSGRTDSRAPLVFDLANQGGATKQTLGKYGTAISEILRKNLQKDELEFARNFHCLLEEGPNDATFFSSVRNLYLNLQQVSSSEELRPLADEAARIVQSSPPAAEQIGQWEAQMVKERISQLDVTKRWVALATIARNGKWLPPARNVAMQLIRDNASIALPIYLRGIEPGSRSEESCRPFLTTILADRTSLIDETLAKITTAPTKAAANQAVLLINAILSKAADRELSWAAQAAFAPSEIRTPLIRCILKRLDASTGEPTISWLDGLLSKVDREKQETSSFCLMVYIPLLRQFLKRDGLEDDVWQRFATRWIRLTLQQEMFDEIRDVLPSCRSRITGEILQEWKTLADSQRHGDALDRILREVGFNRAYEMHEQLSPLNDHEMSMMPRLNSKTKSRTSRRPPPLALYSFVFAILTALMCYMPNIVRLCKPLPDIQGHIPENVAFWIMVVAVALWLIGEVTLRLIRVSSLYLPRLRIARWSLITVLGSTFVALSVRFGEIAWHWING